MRPNIKTFEEVKENIGEDFFGRYQECVEAAYQDWLQYMNFNSTMDVFIPIDLTTKANYIHNRICGRLMEEFKGSTSIKVEVSQQLVVVRVNDEYVFRTKKIHPKGRVSYTDTNQQRAFLNQKADSLFKDAQLITGGYMMNRANTEFLGVYFVCHSAGAKGGVEWFTNYNKYTYQQESMDFGTYQIPEVIEKTATSANSKISIRSNPQRDINTGTDNR